MKRFKPEIFCLAGICISIICMKLFGHGEVLDARIYFDKVESLDFFKSLSEKGQKAYLRNECFDLALIVSYSTLSFLFVRRLFTAEQRFILLSVLPGTFDFTETLLIIIVLLMGTGYLPNWLGVVTLLKWVSGLGVLLYFSWRTHKKHRLHL